jgi:hypothetical protein
MRRTYAIQHIIVIDDVEELEVFLVEARDIDHARRIATIMDCQIELIEEVLR